MADPKTKPPIKEAEEKYLKNLNTTIELWNKKKEAKERKNRKIRHIKVQSQHMNIDNKQEKKIKKKENKFKNHK